MCWPWREMLQVRSTGSAKPWQGKAVANARPGRRAGSTFMARLSCCADNVPGVAGIGPKTAVALLKQFGSLDEVLQHAEEAKPKKAAANLSSGGAEGGGHLQVAQHAV